MICIFCKHEFQYINNECQYIKNYICPECECEWKIIDDKLIVCKGPDPNSDPWLIT